MNMTSQNNHSVSVSVILIAYNQECFVRDACESILSQSCEPIEIILSDDCSTDETFSIMQDIVGNYSGPHRVILRRNERNLGLVEHINTVVNLCSGEIIVYAAGDDISVNDRVLRTVDLFDNSSALIVHSGVMEIDELGKEIVYVDPPPS